MAEALKGFAPVAKQRSFVSDQDIIARLDVIAEYRNLGVRFVTTTPNEDGWVDCHGMGRDDENASAGVHVASGYFNDFGDPNNAETRHSLFDMAWMYGPFNDFSEAKRHFAEKVGIQLRGKRDPDKNLVIHENSEEDDRVWRCTICLRKPGITVQALRHAGAKPGVYRGNLPVVALPVVGTTLDIEHPIGRVMLPIGNDLPVLNKDGSVKSREKMKTTGGSDGGLVIAPSDIEVLKDPERRKNIEAVWKVEGITDLLAFHAQLPANLVGKVIPFTNSDGCKANPVEAHLEHFNDLIVYVVGDADDPGEIGAKKWASKLATHARKTTHVRIAEDVTRKHGKDLRDCFTKEGWTYYDLVDQAEKFDPVDKRPKPFSNYREFGEGEIEPIIQAEIGKRLQSMVTNKVMRLGKSLFVDEHNEDQEVRWIKDANELFSWIRDELDPIDWKDRKDGLVKRSELLVHLRNSKYVQKYRQISSLPHYPEYKDTYYMHDYEPSGDGTYLRKLIEFFNPAEDIDQSLIMALFLTPFCGLKGIDGRRPIFVITSDDGPGAGKTTLAEKVGIISTNNEKGSIEFTQFEDPGDMTKKFVDPDNSGIRVARIDNIKTSKFSSSSIESFITQRSYQGHRMYEGQASVPNRMTWIFTVNGVSLSRDMAQRSIIIKIRKPEADEGWEQELDEFMQTHRRKIICDILAVLAEEISLDHFKASSRWSIWEKNILARCCHRDSLADTQSAIRYRSEVVDADGSDIEILEDHIESKLKDLRDGTAYNIENCKVHIPSVVIAKWWQECFKDGKSNKAIWLALNQISDQNHGENGIKKNPSRTNGRGYIFTRGGCQDIDYNLKRFLDPSSGQF